MMEKKDAVLIRLAGLVPESIVDGPGLRFAIFVQGCPHHCEGCHNPETHDFQAGRVADVDRIFEKIQQYPLIHGVTFSGGEPFCQPQPLAYLAERLKEKGYHLMCYSGYTFEELLGRAASDRDTERLLQCLDILVDGRFELPQRSLELKFRGSKNQRILDVPKSIAEGRAIDAEI